MIFYAAGRLGREFRAKIAAAPAFRNAQDVIA
jgi:hypothetical protein